MLPHQSRECDALLTLNVKSLPQRSKLLKTRSHEILRQIVGTSQTQGGSTTHAVLWRNGAIIDLGTLGGDNSNANGINDSSQIAGGSLLTGNTAYHAVLWVGF